MFKLFTLTLFLSAVVSAQNCPAGYLYSRSVTVNAAQVTGTMSNFPMLVINPTSGIANPNNTKTAGNGGHVTNANGYDIVFASGGSLLPFELVGHGTANTTYSATTGDGEFWVKVSSLAVGSVVYLCYGNSAITTYQGADSTVWSAYKLAAHMGTASTLGITDSSGNTTITNTNATAAAGKLAGGAAFNGTNACFQSASINLTGTNKLAISMWLNWTTFANTDNLLMESSANFSGNDNSVLIDPNESGSTKFQAAMNDTHLVNSNSAEFTRPSAGSFHYYTFVMDKTAAGATQVIPYVDGVAVSYTKVYSATLAGTFGTYVWNFMSRNCASLNAAGTMDEVRFSTTLPSANWITAEYNNQNAPASFYTVGSESSLISFSITPTTIPSNFGSVSLTLVGSGTTWGSTTRFTLSGVSGMSCTTGCSNSPTVTDTTHVVVVVNTSGSGTGTLTLTESVTGTATATTSVLAGTFTISPTAGNLNSVQTLTLVGTNTSWSSPAGLFTLSGGTGASIGTATIATTTTGTIALTVGTASGALTITDTSTGATAVFTAGGSGSGGCVIVGNN